jgi:hypothetical protein
MAVTGAALIALPVNATKNLPTLKEQVQHYWPTLDEPSLLAAQVEQETCISLKSKRCWSSRAELRTSRERGVGLGQITKTAKVDWLANLKAIFPDALAKFTWQNPYDATLQLRALVLKDQYNFQLLSFGGNERERIAFTLAAYNGGIDGVMSDRILCTNTPGCDASLWFGNVERTSLKAKVGVKGYGQSFFCINREYPWNIMFVRRTKYGRYFKDGSIPPPVPAAPKQYGCQ